MPKSIYIFLLLILGGCTLAAHPHVFIDCSFQMDIDSSGISKIKTFWEFDEVFSETIRNDYDLNKNNVFEQEEIESIYSTAFINTKNYNYFLDIAIASQKVQIDSVYSFNAHLQGGKLVYEFIFHIPAKYPTCNKNIKIMSYDPSYYIMVETNMEKGLQINNTSSKVIIEDIIQCDVDFDDYGVLPVNTIDLYILPEK